MHFSLRRLFLISSMLISLTVAFPAAFAQSTQMLETCSPELNYTLEMNGSMLQAFKFDYAINDPQGGPTQVGLGVTLTSSTGQPWNDVANDQIVSITPGTAQTVYRYFSYGVPTTGGSNVPPDFSGGNAINWTAYSATCAIWSGQPGYSTWWGSNTVMVYVGQVPLS